MSAARKITPDEVRTLLWSRGNLSWKLHSGQALINQALNRSTGKLYVCNCARQFGKSYAMVCRSIELAIKNPRSRSKYATAFLTDLVEFIIPTFEKILEDCPQNLRPKYKVQGSKWVFPNGSEIKLVGLDKNPNGLRGNTIDLIVIDESGFVDQLDYLYKSIIIPATTHRPNAKIIMISTPPSTPAHEFTDFAQRAERDGNYSKFTVFDNPMLDDRAIQVLAAEYGGETSTTWRREFLCEFVTDADSQIIPEWRDSFISEPKLDQFTQFYHRYVGMDLGVKDFTVALFGYYDFRRATLVIEDEVKLSGPTLTTLLIKNSISEIEQRLWGELKPYRRVCDNNWPILIQDLASEHNMSFIAVTKDSLEAMINEVRLMVQKGQIEVSPKCLQLIGSLKYGVWDKSKKKFARSTAYGHFDALAALIYLVRYLDKRMNPVPATFGFDTFNTVFKTPRIDNAGSRLFGQLFHHPVKKPTY